MMRMYYYEFINPKSEIRNPYGLILPKAGQSERGVS